jgi:hypothetical protein
MDLPRPCALLRAAQRGGSGALGASRGRGAQGVLRPQSPTCRPALAGARHRHELADGAWSGGATEHKPDHGPWQDRLDAAFQARWEWPPARPPAADDPTRVFRAVGVGDLAGLMLLDVRSRRDEPVPGPDMHRADRSKLGTEQRDWLLGELEESDAAWQLVVSPSTLSTILGWRRRPSRRGPPCSS